MVVKFLLLALLTFGGQDVQVTGEFDTPEDCVLAAQSLPDFAMQTVGIKPDDIKAACIPVKKV